jgi:hypothetical protein
MLQIKSIKFRSRGYSGDGSGRLLDGAQISTSNERLRVDDTEAWWLIRIVFWSILLFVAIRVAMAIIFCVP